MPAGTVPCPAVFQVLEIDQERGLPRAGMPGPTQGEVTIIRCAASSPSLPFVPANAFLGDLRHSLMGVHVVVFII